jgi:uncharacterized protein Yka (UPF0111/DUF47 family)
MKFNVLDLLLPRETKFYKYFDQQVDYLLEGSRIFRDLLSQISTLDETTIKGKLRAIQICEQRGDEIEVTIIDELHKTFITPIDREDIHLIAISIDRALDILNSIARKFDIYAMRTVPKYANDFAEIIVQISVELGNLMRALGKRSNVNELVAKMHKLENQADDLFHLGMAELFKNFKDPVEIIKYKEVYEHLESIVDSVDFIGKMVRGIIVKLG